MKKIEALIQPGKFDDVRAALEAAGYPGLTITEVEGHGRQKGVARSFFGKVVRTRVLPKLKLEIVAPDDRAGEIVKALLAAASTGRAGDGKVFVHRVEAAYKISGTEEGEAAVS